MTHARDESIDRILTLIQVDPPEDKEKIGQHARKVSQLISCLGTLKTIGNLPKVENTILEIAQKTAGHKKGFLKRLKKSSESELSAIISAAVSTLGKIGTPTSEVFLAKLDDRQAVKLIHEQGLPRFTAKSIIKERDYLAELKQVRKLGYAFDDEEYLPGVKAVAVSLGNHRGLPLAIWVVGFAGSMTEKVIPEVIQQTVATAKKLQSVIDESA